MVFLLLLICFQHHRFVVCIKLSIKNHCSRSEALHLENTVFSGILEANSVINIHIKEKCPGDMLGHL